jgi:hypothetical protein
MNILLDTLDELNLPNVDPSVRKAAAHLLVLVPTCSLFWIEEAGFADIRDVIHSRIFGKPREHLSRAAIRLGEQLDEAELR